MSHRIIERVLSRFEDCISDEIQCRKCGAGNWKLKEARPCGCGGIQEPIHREYQVKIRGHIVLKCDCGKRIEADIGRFTISCDCGADYNGSGDLLAPREQWGEETGESAADILMGDIDSEGY